jgi:hypothetical protein
MHVRNAITQAMEGMQARVLAQRGDDRDSCKHTQKYASVHAALCICCIQVPRNACPNALELQAALPASAQLGRGEGALEGVSLHCLFMTSRALRVDDRHSCRGGDCMRSGMVMRGTSKRRQFNNAHDGWHVLVSKMMLLLQEKCPALQRSDR